MDSGIYCIRNIISDKVYVGSAKSFERRKKQHFDDLNKRKHHSIKLQRSFDKHGIAAFVFEIIEEIPYEKDIILERENYHIDRLNSKNHGYNIADASFGDILTTHPNRDEIRAKISQTLRYQISLLSEDERLEKWSKPGELNGMFGRKHSKESRMKMSLSQSGPRPHLRGRALSKEHRAKISENAKLRVGELNPFYGRTHSEETRKILSERHKGIKPSNIKIIVIDGVEYEGLPAASKATGIKATTIWYRIQSKNPKFVAYQYKETVAV